MGNSSFLSQNSEAAVRGKLLIFHQILKSFFGKRGGSCNWGAPSVPLMVPQMVAIGLQLRPEVTWLDWTYEPVQVQEPTL